ncbi:hypothetical protein ACWPKS_09165 [Coraliomargarita sp. W4R72]
MDFFLTFVHLAGGRTGEITELEGMDLMPLFQEPSSSIANHSTGTIRITAMG